MIAHNEPILPALRAGKSSAKLVGRVFHLFVPIWPSLVNPFAKTKLSKPLPLIVLEYTTIDLSQQAAINMIFQPSFEGEFNKVQDKLER